MSYQSVKKARLLAKKSKLESQITTLEETLDSLLATEVESYKYDSGEGSQQVKRRKLSEIQDQLDRLESRLDAICRRLAGLGLTSIRLNRKVRKSYNYPSGGNF